MSCWTLSSLAGKRVVGSTRARRTALPEQEIPDPMAAK
jgi:hypothetical protein